MFHVYPGRINKLDREISEIITNSVGHEKIEPTHITQKIREGLKKNMTMGWYRFKFEIIGHDLTIIFSYIDDKCNLKDLLIRIG